MEDKNVLTEGIEKLYIIKENLLELNGYQEKSLTLTEEEKDLDNQITAKEKLMNDEINSVIKKRKDEITVSFDEHIDKTKARIKKVKARKDKLKDTKVSERVSIETSEFEEEKVLYLEEIKEVFKVNHIAGIFNTKLYYTLFMPRSIKDIFYILLTLLVLLVGLPLGLYNYVISQTTFAIVITYIIIFLLVGVSYVFINHVTKEKHRDAFANIRIIRGKLAATQKKIHVLKKSILKDKDESSYGLEKFDKELKELDTEIAAIAEEKKNALVSFESATKYAISEGIKENYQKELTELKENQARVYEEQRKAETMAKEFAIEISKKYEAFVGKEVLSISLIDELIQIIESGQASTISEALNQKKNQAVLIQKMLPEKEE